MEFPHLADVPVSKRWPFSRGMHPCGTRRASVSSFGSLKLQAVLVPAPTPLPLVFYVPLNVC